MDLSRLMTVPLISTVISQGGGYSRVVILFLKDRGCTQTSETLGFDPAQR